MTTEEAKARLRQGALRCEEVIEILESLGFTVRDASKPGHKVFKHPGFRFYGSNFTCGHGRNPEVKKSYLKKIVRIIEENEDELKTFLEERR